MSTPDPAAVAGGLDELAAAISRMREVVTGGGLVELAGLDAEAQRLCQAATALPPPAARPLLARFETILAALAALEADIRRTGLGGADESDAASRRRLAQSAYGRSATPDAG